MYSDLGDDYYLETEWDRKRNIATQWEDSPYDQHERMVSLITDELGSFLDWDDLPSASQRYFLSIFSSCPSLARFTVTGIEADPEDGLEPLTVVRRSNGLVSLEGGGTLAVFVIAWWNLNPAPFADAIPLPSDLLDPLGSSWLPPSS